MVLKWLFPVMAIIVTVGCMLLHCTPGPPLPAGAQEEGGPIRKLLALSIVECNKRAHAQGGHFTGTLTDWFFCLSEADPSAATDLSAFTVTTDSKVSFVIALGFAVIGKTWGMWNALIFFASSYVGVELLPSFLGQWVCSILVWAMLFWNSQVAFLMYGVLKARALPWWCLKDLLTIDLEGMHDLQGRVYGN